MPLDHGLTQVVKKADEGTPLPFAFVPSEHDGTVFVAKSLTSVKDQISAAEKAAHAKAIRGRCIGESAAEGDEGRVLYFEVKQLPGGTLTAKLRRCLKEHTGRDWAAQFRQRDDAEESMSAAAAGPAPTSASPAAPHTPETSAPAPDASKAAVLQRLHTLSGPYTAAIAHNGPEVPRMHSLFEEVKAHVGKSDFDQASKVLKELEWLVYQQAPGTGMAAWHAARLEAVNQLRHVEAAVVHTKRAEVPQVVTVLESIVKNLTLNPDTPQSIAELERYLRDDDVITAAEQVPAALGHLHLREPLLKALEQLKAPA
jgi:hypothetical protein